MKKLFTKNKSRPNLRPDKGILIVLIFLIVGGITSCKKFLEVDPPKDMLVRSEVFKNDQSATSAMLGIYSDMVSTFKLISSNVTWFTGLNGDELASPSNSTSSQPFFRNEIMPDNDEVLNAWTHGYQYIYDSSAVIEGLNNSEGVSSSTKNQLMGEAYFTRAFAYFYLTNLFGDIPLITRTDYRESAVASRSPQISIYDQMIADLKKAQELLPGSYPTSERVRPNKWAVTTLLARVYLYKKEWALAEAEATAVINSGSYTLSSLSTVFLKGSNETIFQFYSVNPGYNTLVASRFVPSSATAAPTYNITSDLLNTFESGDQRKTNWLGTSVAAGITFYHSYKYKIRNGGATVSEYLIAFRLAELYLIRAEARANKGVNLPDALADVNMVRKRAGLSDLSSTLSQPQILSAIEKERRTEFFTEMGHRWFDLRRTGRIDAVMQAFKPTTWKSTAALWPIPSTQIERNRQLTQNPGYN